MKISRVIVLIMLILPLPLYSQVEAIEEIFPDSAGLIIERLETGMPMGKVTVIQDPRLTVILRKHFEFNKTSGVAGFRILIYKGREISRANQLKAEFEESFGYLSFRTSVEYNEPDFSTLVGGFRTKEDAYRYKQMFSTRFPQSYLVPARISMD